MLKWLFLVMSSKSVRRQPEKLSHRWWIVWNEVRPGDQCWQSGVLVDQICQRHEWVVPDIAARYRDELCNSVLQSYTVCAPGLKSIEGWRVRRWCGRSVDALGDLQWKCIHSSRRTRAVYLSVIGVKMQWQTTAFNERDQLHSVQDEQNWSQHRTLRHTADEVNDSWSYRFAAYVLMPAGQVGLKPPMSTVINAKSCLQPL